MLTIENFEVMGWEHAIRGMRNPKNSWEKSDSGWGKKVYSHTGPEDCDRELESVPVAYDYDDEYYLGPNDQKLMMNLRNAGTDHRKFMRMITVYLDITAPMYWLKEFDTYKVGTVANSCSTMHKIHDKEFTLENFSTEHLMSGIEDLSVRKSFIAVNEHDGVSCLWSPIHVLHTVIEALNVNRKMYLETKDKRYWWQMIQLLPSSYNQKRTVMLNYEVLANMYKSRRNHKLDEWHTFCDWIEKLPYSELITGGEQE